MKKLLIVAGCLVMILSGCAGLTGVGKEKRVQTLGVLPILVDFDSIDHSAREGLMTELLHGVSEVDDRLVARLREKGDYSDVRLIEASPKSLAREIILSREKIGEGAAAHNAYSFNPKVITRLIGDNRVDAVLVVVVNGIARNERRWKEGRFSLEFLDARYRSLLYSAAIVTPPAVLLWVREQPPGEVFLHLDYPDFSEAYWNKTEVVQVKEITLFGLDRTLAELEEGLITSKIYNDMIRNLFSDLKNGM